MSDLQCPAIVILVPAQAPAPSLAGRAVAATVELTDLADGFALRRAVDEMSDLYRGETVVVVAAAEVIRQALHRAAAPDGPVIVAVDSSGWTPAS